ncbi:MAG: transporter ATP-binding protein [Rhodoglobus sp.]|nr:transporter ATP-binding protein [Rhodoglobus sp.]
MSYVLEVRDLHLRLGASHIIKGVDLTVGEGEAVALFGRNGVGKSTLMHALMGLVRASAGSFLLSGEDLTGKPIDRIARAGLAIVPQGRRIFPTLTVQETLTLGARKAAGGWTLERVYDLLPRLAERRKQHVGLMSGGEQQMVAIGRALLRNPKLLLLDEPSEGLAPRIVGELGEVMAALRSDGLSILIVEQNLELGVNLADRVLIMDMGRIVHESPVQEFRDDPSIAHRHLGIL